jgi:phosphonate transport system substrate-binding protein
MKLIRLNFTRTILLALLAFLSSASHAADATDAYVFSVVPQFKPAQLHKEWSPLIERLSRDTGLKFRLVISPSNTKFESELGNGAPDFAFVNPYQAVLGMKGNGYQPMLRDKKPLNGILVVRKDSPYKKLKDLDGKIIGFPSPQAFGASLYMRALLSESNPIKFTPKYLNNHNLVFKHVALGHVAAGGSVNAALNDESPELRDQLTILFQTPDVASHPLIAHPRVSANVRKNVTNALLAMQQDVEGRAMLKEVRLPNLVDANYQNDYQPLDKLNIQKYLVQEAE